MCTLVLSRLNILWTVVWNTLITLHRGGLGTVVMDHKRKFVCLILVQLVPVLPIVHGCNFICYWSSWRVIFGRKYGAELLQNANIVKRLPMYSEYISKIGVIGECRSHWKRQRAGRKRKENYEWVIKIMSNHILVENVAFESLINYALLFLKIQHCFITSMISNFFTYYYRAVEHALLLFK